MGRKIDVICNDGSPMGVHYSDIFGKNGRIGIGGAELALMTVLEGWTKQGHEVSLYNNPKKGNESPFVQKNLSIFDKNEDRDILVIFRSPNHRAIGAKGLKVWWSTDQYTVGDFRSFSQVVDKIVTISPFHDNHLREAYGIENTHVIDLPVRTWEYEQNIEKIPNRLIFTSVPDRGLEYVAELYPLIKQAIPDVSLVITSDYRLWGNMHPSNIRYTPMFLRAGNVQFLGAVSRERLIEEQLKAQVLFYPCSYDELFCIACAEAQVAGALPVTTDMGALATTNMGVMASGHPRMQKTKELLLGLLVETIRGQNFPEFQRLVQKNAIKRFSLDRILGEWDKVFNDS